MREIIAAIFVVVAACLIAFRSVPEVRETLRGWRASTDETERMDAYKQGKALFVASQTDPAPSCKAWGDDNDEDARPVFGDLWLARGHFTTSGSVIPSQWCVLFEINKGSPVICVTGQNASKVIYMVGTGQFQAAINHFSPNDPRANTNRHVGSWMWQGTSPLDQPARRDGR